MPTPRRHAAAAVVGGKLYVTGGGFGNLIINRVEVFDPATNSWSTGPLMPTPRMGHAAVAMGSNLMVVGGQRGGDVGVNSVDIYSPQSDEWTSGTAMQTARLGLGAAVVGGKLYAVGGADGSQTLNVVEIYSTRTAGK